MSLMAAGALLAFDPGSGVVPSIQHVHTARLRPPTGTPFGGGRATVCQHAEHLLDEQLKNLDLRLGSRGEVLEAVQHHEEGRQGLLHVHVGIVGCAVQIALLCSVAFRVGPNCIDLALDHSDEALQVLEGQVNELFNVRDALLEDRVGLGTLFTGKELADQRRMGAMEAGATIVLMLAGFGRALGKEPGLLDGLVELDGNAVREPASHCGHEGINELTELASPLPKAFLKDPSSVLGVLAKFLGTVKVDECLCPGLEVCQEDLPLILGKVGGGLLDLVPEIGDHIFTVLRLRGRHAGELRADQELHESQEVLDRDGASWFSRHMVVCVGVRLATRWVTRKAIDT